MSIKRFIRFTDQSGTIQYGEPSASDVKGSLEGKSVEVLSGDPYKGFSKTGKQATIKQVCAFTGSRNEFSQNKLLSPIESIPIFECIGLNYAHHAKEANVSLSILPSEIQIDNSLPAHTPLSPSRLHQTSRRPRRTLRRHPHPPRSAIATRLRRRAHNHHLPRRQEHSRVRSSLLRPRLHSRK